MSNNNKLVTLGSATNKLLGNLAIKLIDKGVLTKRQALKIIKDAYKNKKK